MSAVSFNNIYNDALFFCRRYFKYELLAKGAITKEDLPIFLFAWLDRSNSTCMFSANQQRTWSTSHLTGGGWYLDCAPSFTPPFETELRKSREAVGDSGIEMIDLQSIEDEHERAKAISRGFVLLLSSHKSEVDKPVFLPCLPFVLEFLL